MFLGGCGLSVCAEAQPVPCHAFLALQDAVPDVLPPAQPCASSGWMLSLGQDVALGAPSTNPQCVTAEAGL